jgi:hypothetical protein
MTDPTDELIDILNNGHPLKWEPEVQRVTFTSCITEPDDVFRIREHFPALDKLTIRCEIPL